MTNKVNWLLENDCFDADLEPIVDEITKQGFNYKRINYKDSTKPEEITELFAPNECVVFYGSLGLSRVINRYASWTPGLFCDLPKFECVNYYTYFGDYLLNSNYVMLPFGELNRRKQFLIDLLGVNGQVFVRPSSGFKLFTGRVISEKTWESDVKFLGFYDVEPDKVVVVAPPQKVLAEYRLIVVEDEVVSGCQYITDNEIVTGPCVPEVMIYGQEVVKKVKYNPEPVWILDICKTEKEFKVLEVGAFSTSGLYCSPQQPIVEKVSTAAYKMWLDINGC